MLSMHPMTLKLSLRCLTTVILIPAILCPHTIDPDLYLQIQYVATRSRIGDIATIHCNPGHYTITTGGAGSTNNLIRSTAANAICQLNQENYNTASWMPMPHCQRMLIFP